MANDKRRGTVKLSQYNEQAQVAPSATRDRSIVVGFYNAEGTAPVHPGCFTPAEADAFIAAITAALGRPAPDSTPLEARLLAAIEAADEHAEQGWSLGVEAADLAAAKGRAEGLRAALAMAREAGPTVPRVAVAAVRERFDKWIREEGGKRNEYVEGMTVGIKDAILALDALLATPTEGR
jgi:hypothetical protein